MSVLTINSREARTRWRDLLDRVLAGDSDIIIERNGKPVAAMIPIEDYEVLLDKLEDLRSARRAAKLYESWKKNPAIAQSIEDVEAELIDEGLLDGQE